MGGSAQTSIYRNSLPYPQPNAARAAKKTNNGEKTKTDKAPAPKATDDWKLKSGLYSPGTHLFSLNRKIELARQSSQSKVKYCRTIRQSKCKILS